MRYSYACMLLLATLWVAVPSFAQEVIWAKLLGSESPDYGTFVASDQEGNSYIAGWFSKATTQIGDFTLTANGVGDVYIAKLNPAGKVLWAKRFGGDHYAYDDRPTNIHADNKGNLYVVGEFFNHALTYDQTPISTTHIKYASYGAGYLLKIEATTGRLLWANTSNVDIFNDVTTDAQDQVYVTGSFYNEGTVGGITLCGGNCRKGGTNSSVTDVVTAKFSPTGSVLWAKNAGGSVYNSSAMGYGIATDLSNRVYVVGTFYIGINFATASLTAPPNLNNSFLLSYDPQDGTERFVRQMNSAYGYAIDIAVDKLGNCYTTGNTSIGRSTGDVFINKYSSNGDLQWEKTAVGPDADRAVGVRIDSQQHVLLCGYFHYDIKLNDFSLSDGTSLRRTFLARLDDTGELVWMKAYAGAYVGVYSTSMGFSTTPQGGIYIGSALYGSLSFNDTTHTSRDTDALLMRLQDNSIFTSGVWGRVYQDFNKNCRRDAGEASLAGRWLLIEPGRQVVQTNAAGYWHLPALSAGTYTITADLSGSWQSSCAATQTFSVSASQTLQEGPSFGLLSGTPCAQPDISIYAPFLRRCFSEQLVRVRACNLLTATGILGAAYADVRLDPLLVPQSASLPYTALGDNTYRFQVNDLKPGECRDFTISCQLSCEAVLSQTLCLEASLFPVDACVLDPEEPEPDKPGGVSPCRLPWDKSSLNVRAYCRNDSLHFNILNTGEPGGGDMQCYSAVRLYVDGQYVKLDSVKLTGGESRLISFAGDGRTWRLEADQHPLHPGKSRPNATLERCGPEVNWTSKLVTILPQDDADPVKSVYCGLVTGSYDPNDKTGYPLGVGDEHTIAPNTRLQYLVRFQNTGTDTAFTVVIRDTLSTHLNILSVRPGVSSHPYTFRMYGQGVLEWTFNNILLPDSTTDEPGSNGFVQFSVQQQPQLPDGTQIRNAAAIYFDFNEPLLTNQTLHTIGRNLHKKDWHESEALQLRACQEYSLNSVTYNSSGTYLQKVATAPGVYKLLELELTIDEKTEVQLSEQEGSLQASLLPGASYQWVLVGESNTPISGATQANFTPTASGTYAVMVSRGSCSSLSESIPVTVAVLGTGNQAAGTGIEIFPNPSRELLTIRLLQPGQQLSVSLRTLSGQLLLSKSSRAADALSLDMSKQKPGLYLLEVIQDDRVYRTRIVKQ